MIPKHGAALYVEDIDLLQSSYIVYENNNCLQWPLATLAKSHTELHPHPNKSANARATTLVARRKSSSAMFSSARLALLSDTVRGPQP